MTIMIRCVRKICDHVCQALPDFFMAVPIFLLYLLNIFDSSEMFSIPADNYILISLN